MDSVTFKKIKQKIISLQEQTNFPVIIVIEGIVGSGKSYLADQIIKYSLKESILLTMDLFFKIPRTQWKDKFEQDKGVLMDWYNKEKAQEVLEKIKQKQKFVEKNCYNISNGELDKEIYIDASKCKLVLFEGLLSSIIFKNQSNLNILVDTPENIALLKAKYRDKSERDINIEKWQLKKVILHDMYLPYMSQIRNIVDFIYKNDFKG